MSEGPRMILAMIIAASLLTFAAPFALSAEREEERLSIPQVPPCSSRYEMVADPAPPAPAANGKRAVEQGYGSHKTWAVEENVELLMPQSTGLGETGLRVLYPEGTSSPSDNGQGGAGFYAKIAGLSGAEHACLQYKVRFEPGFDFVKGGKLPGLYGGTAPSGGDDVSGEDGFSMRFMWREDGQGELYEYVVGMDEDYGQSVGRGMWTFATGEWVTIEQEIILNDPDEKNGVARVWINGEPILEQRNIVYRTRSDIFVDGLMFSSFFGGNGKEWRTPRDQFADFADFRFYRNRDASRS